jgi:hypothetical protein
MMMGYESYDALATESPAALDQLNKSYDKVEAERDIKNGGADKVPKTATYDGAMLNAQGEATNFYTMLVDMNGLSAKSTYSEDTLIKSGLVFQPKMSFSPMASDELSIDKTKKQSRRRDKNESKQPRPNEAQVIRNPSRLLGGTETNLGRSAADIRRLGRDGGAVQDSQSQNDEVRGIIEEYGISGLIDSF